MYSINIQGTDISYSTHSHYDAAKNYIMLKCYMHDYSSCIQVTYHGNPFDMDRSIENMRRLVATK